MAVLRTSIFVCSVLVFFSQLARDTTLLTRFEAARSDAVAARFRAVPCLREWDAECDDGEKHFQATMLFDAQTDAPRTELVVLYFNNNTESRVDISALGAYFVTGNKSAEGAICETLCRSDVPAIIERVRFGLWISSVLTLLAAFMSRLVLEPLDRDRARKTLASKRWIPVLLFTGPVSACMLLVRVFYVNQLVHIGFELLLNFRGSDIGGRKLQFTLTTVPAWVAVLNETQFTVVFTCFVLGFFALMTVVRDVLLRTPSAINNSSRGCLCGCFCGWWWSWQLLLVPFVQAIIMLVAIRAENPVNVFAMSNGVEALIGWGLLNDIALAMLGCADFAVELRRHCAAAAAAATAAATTERRRATAVVAVVTNV